MRSIVLCLALILGFAPRAMAQDDLGLSAPEDVTNSGLLKYLLPRFSLKTGVRITPNASGALVLSTEDSGVAVFQRGDTVYYLGTPDDPRATRFRDWLTSEIGLRTVESFQPSQGAPFTAPKPVEAQTAAVVYEGDPVEGEDLSLTLCGRCHVIGPQNAMNSIGSTPSFAVLRAMSSWDVKFQTFYVLRPHGAFTQVEGVTDPFDPTLPPPIVPVTMTPEDLEAIVAYVAQVEPADLGAPLQLQ